MCGHQCDKAVTKNDTREVIWHHFTAVKWYHIISRFELSNQIDCSNLVGPIRLHVIDDAWCQIWREEFLCSFINEMAASRFVNVSDEDLSQFLEENENKNTLARSKTSSFAIWYWKLLNKNDIRLLTCNNLYLPSIIIISTSGFKYASVTHGYQRDQSILNN